MPRRGSARYTQRTASGIFRMKSVSCLISNLSLRAEMNHLTTPSSRLAAKLVLSMVKRNLKVRNQNTENPDLIQFDYGICDRF